MKYREDVSDLNIVLQAYGLEMKFSLSDKGQRQEIVKIVEQNIDWSEHEGNERNKQRWLSIYESAQILSRREAYLEYCAIQIIDITRRYICAHLSYSYGFNEHKDVSACDLLEMLYGSLADPEIVNELFGCYQSCLIATMKKYNCKPFVETHPIYAVIQRARGLILEIEEQGLKDVDE